MTISQVLRVALSFVAAIPSIVFHEVAHGYMALRLGDPTARDMGRLTLNPLAHIDPIGTILVPLVMVILGGPAFGWAKPVPISPRYFRNPLKGMLYVALAGPGTNVALGLVGLAIGRLLLLAIPFSTVLVSSGFVGNLFRAVFFTLGIFVLFNLFLAVLNMIPVPPLDGSRVLTYFLPAGGRRFMVSLERYGLIIVAALLFFGVFQGLFQLIISGISVLLGQHWIILINAF